MRIHGYEIVVYCERGIAMENTEYIDAVEKFSSMVLKLSWIYTKNNHDANDCCQNVFLKLYNSNTIFVDDNHIKAWLIKVTKNECLNFFKSFWRKKVDLSEEVASIIYDENQRDLLKVILNLPDNYRDILYLYYYEGYKILEICRIFSLNEATVKTRLRRGRIFLKEKLIEEGIYYEE